MSANEQFNQQYEAMIDTVKSRALWRLEDRIDEREAFRCSCFHCGYESLHQPFSLTRHRIVFGRSIRATEAPRQMLRCRRCGTQRHLRDVAELVVPSTIALHDELREALVEHMMTMVQRNESSIIPDAVRSTLNDFRDEASGPVRQQLLGSVAERITPTQASNDQLSALGRELSLDSDQIDAAVTER